MKITKEEFKEFEDKFATSRVMNNMVLIEPARSNDTIITPGGLKLYLDVSYEEAEHACVVGKVVKLPVKLDVENQKSAASLDWKTPLELKVGDRVYYSFVAAIQAIDHYDHFIEVWDEKLDSYRTYLFLRYDKLFVAKRYLGRACQSDRKEMAKSTRHMCLGNRLDEIICLNGYVLAEPIGKEFKTNLIVPDSIKSKIETQRATVRYCGSPNECYYDINGEKMLGDSAKLVWGDEILLTNFANIYLEKEMHAEFEGDKLFFNIQRRHIIAIIKEDRLEPIGKYVSIRKDPRISKTDSGLFIPKSVKEDKYLMGTIERLAIGCPNKALQVGMRVMYLKDRGITYQKDKDISVMSYEDVVGAEIKEELVLFQGRLLITPEPSEVMRSGIMLIKPTEKRTKDGVVKYGNSDPQSPALGDKVMYVGFVGNKIRYKDEDLLIIRNIDVLYIY